MPKDAVDQLQEDWTAQRPDLDAEPMGIVLRIQALAKILGTKTSESLEDFGLQWWQYDVLSALRRQGHPFTLAATELADDVMLSSGAMTNRIDRLEKAGLVQRLEDPGDRRKVLVRLTKRGLALIEQATDARFETATQALDRLTGSQKSDLSDLLRKVLMDQ
jgi:DNA-binding MarR family transcriptional regulator